MITAKDLREKYIEFFESKGHKAIPSASLIPENDSTVLFNTAGMQPLVPHLMGQKHPEGNKLVDVQKCIRTGDIEEVGDNRHLTFFEMLGNWSLGDPEKPDGIGAGYSKEDAIKWSYEFLTDEKWLGLDPKRLYITVFKGENGIERDEKSIKIWQEQFKKHGIEAKVAKDDSIWNDPDIRIFALDGKENFWQMGGETGPCGPDTEIYYDTEPEKGFEKKTFEQLTNESRFLEIWNNVFMEFHKIGKGKFEPLKQKNVDTGMGVERTITVLNGYKNVFEAELFTPILEKIRGIKSPQALFLKGKDMDVEKSERIIADHIKAAVMILADDKKIAPSNVERGYVLRRLIRRAVRYGKILGIEGNFMRQIAEVVVDMYKDVYEEVGRNKEFIFSELNKEEEKFRKTLESGLKQFDKYFKESGAYWVNDKKSFNDSMKNLKDGPKILPGIIAFNLYQSYGFPIEMTIEEAKSREMEVDIDGFNEELKKHQELSRTASAGMFKSGLADNSEMTTKLHTATHLLHAALRKTLGNHVEQRGSNINPERLRFDFSHSEKLTAEQIQEVENWVNEAIKKDLPVVREEMSPEEAKESGAMGLFDAKYGSRVSVYAIKDGDAVLSKEICTGPHVGRTGDIGHFKIKKEQSSSQGIRRIKAVVENIK